MLLKMETTEVKKKVNLDSNVTYFLQDRLDSAMFGGLSCT